jgi:dUTPase
MSHFNNMFLKFYPSYMVLKIFIGDADLRSKYNDAVIAHNTKIINNPTHIDAGFDIFVPSLHLCSDRNQINKIDHGIKCSAMIHTPLGEYNTGYYMHPRSSIYKTPLRLANSTGIIDAGYRGNLIGMFDCKNAHYEVEQYDRILQICAPSLMPIFVEIVNNESELGDKTVRGEGGFGSTGK